jgi:hypothetical protein
MKKLILIIAVICFFLPLIIEASEEDYNVLSYYAIANSIDGQLMANERNVIRFFPVYSVEQKIKSVEFKIYAGASVYSIEGQETNSKQYWQTNLPEFELGEAIQKVEAIVTIPIREAVDWNLHEGYLRIADKLYHFENRFPILYDSLKGTSYENVNFRKTILSLFSIFVSDFDRLVYAPQNLRNSMYTSDYKHQDSTSREIINDSYNRTNSNPYMQSLFYLGHDNIFSTLVNPDITSQLVSHEIIRDINIARFSQYDSNYYRESISLIEDLDRRLTSASVNYKYNNDYALNIRIINILNDYITLCALDGYFEPDKYYEGLIADNVRNKMYEVYADSTKRGPGFKRGPALASADIRVTRTEESDQINNIEIKYRNYNNDLRKMPALDSAERVGIFRIRYVPFPVTSVTRSDEPTLVPFDGDNAHTVFEVGVNLGDRIVASDLLVPKELDWRRLGVSFAITEDLFKSEADILALLFTYEFNSYVSIGAGFNFAHDRRKPYFSIGINQKAFQALTANLAGLF